MVKLPMLELLEWILLVELLIIAAVEIAKHKLAIVIRILTAKGIIGFSLIALIDMMAETI